MAGDKMRAGRGKKRVLVHEEVIINNIIKAHALDISEGGMYISTPAEFLSGAVLEISFRINEETMNVKALVQHSRPGIGIGVRFISITPENHALIKKFIMNEVVSL